MPSVRRTVPLLALLAALLSAPAAHAALTPSRSVATKTVTITGDDAADVLVIGESGGDLVHNIASMDAFDFDAADGVQRVPADGSYQLVINSAGGDDSITVQTRQVLRVLADLGAGDDLFQGATDGSGSADEIAGGAGDDRIAAGRGADDMLGGDGNDTLVWNNGDGSDEIDGQGGNDTAEVNGSPLAGDQFHVQPENGRLRLDRLNLGLFNLLIAATTERLQVNALGGDDKITAGEGVGALGVSLVLDGGTGNDDLAGGDGADAINGGEDVDTLSGGGGGDRIAGNRGNDVMAGGDGDDTLVWNNGDGTDKADGNAGFDAMEVNGAGAGDVFTVKPNAARTQLERTNLVPFAIDLSAEVLDLNALGGDDTVTASGAPQILLDVDGGAGNDALTGDAGHDALRGGGGADAITGGGGSDAIDGDDGDDVITADDSQADLVRCGAGSDRARTDREGIDGVTDCEIVDRPIPAPVPPAQPPATGPKAAAVKIATGKVTVSKLRARIRLECPAGATTCEGRLTLTTPRAVRIGRVRVIVVLGSASYRILPGTSTTVTVKLTKALRAIAGKAKRVRVAAVAASDAGAGTTLVATRTVTLTKKKRW